MDVNLAPLVQAPDGSSLYQILLSFHAGQAAPTAAYVSVLHAKYMSMTRLNPRLTCCPSSHLDRLAQRAAAAKHSPAQQAARAAAADQIRRQAGGGGGWWGAFAGAMAGAFAGSMGAAGGPVGPGSGNDGAEVGAKVRVSFMPSPLTLSGLACVGMCKRTPLVHGTKQVSGCVASAVGLSG